MSNSYYDKYKDLDESVKKVICDGIHALIFLEWQTHIKPSEFYERYYKPLDKATLSILKERKQSFCRYSTTDEEMLISFNQNGITLTGNEQLKRLDLFHKLINQGEKDVKA